ncbi:MAG: hypothetical protein V1777_03715 [Candidatus Micrarchaeota archaeon]
MANPAIKKGETRMATPRQPLRKRIGIQRKRVGTWLEQKSRQRQEKFWEIARKKKERRQQAADWAARWEDSIAEGPRERLEKAKAKAKKAVLKATRVSQRHTKGRIGWFIRKVKGK